MNETVFDLILAKKIPSWVVWEDKDYMAFLTPFPNTPGLTVVIPKINHGDYFFELNDEVITGLVLASKKVASILKRAFAVKRVAMVVEGTGVPHVHVKLYPLHGKIGQGSGVWSHHQEFYPEYVGYLTTAEGPKMSDQELDQIQAKIIKAGKDEN
ncbi:MAG: HIT family protein [Candidatus Saccharimonadales bacterium]